MLPHFDGKEELISGTKKIIFDDVIPVKVLDSIFQSIEELSPENIIKAHKQKFEIDNNQTFVCIGKNAYSFANAIKNNLDKMYIAKIWVFQPQGYFEKNEIAEDGWYLDLDHPITSEQNISAVLMFLKDLQSNKKSSIFHFFISGGSSAVFGIPEVDIPSELYFELNDVLFKAGLSIEELNFCRQLIDGVKGGKLLSYLEKQKVFNWIASDVVSDDPKIVGSGITVGAIPSNDHLLGVMETLFSPFFGPMVLTRLLKTQSTNLVKTPTKTTIILSRRMLIEKFLEKVTKMNLECKSLDLSLEGEFTEIGNQLSWFIDTDFTEGMFVCAGEWTVELPKIMKGKGGRLSHLITYFSLLIQSKCTIIGIATDGNDGNSGSNFFLLKTPINSENKSKARTALNNFDTNSFVENVGITGHFVTNMNLMDILIFIK